MTHLRNAVILGAAMLAMPGLMLAQGQGHHGNHGGHGDRRGQHSGYHGGRGHYGGGRRMGRGEFRRGFGREHLFAPAWIGGEYDGFFFGGYEFGLYEPWPEGWAYDDQVYVDDIGGDYVLVNPRYPGVTVGLVIR